MKKQVRLFLLQVFNLFNIFSLAFQPLIALPVLLASPVMVRAEEAITADAVSLSFDTSAHEFNLRIKTNQELSYLLSYVDEGRDPAVEQAMQGQLMKLDDSTFGVDLYAGTCSGEDCTPATFQRGSLQIGSDFSTSFSYENGQITLDSDVQSTEDNSSAMYCFDETKDGQSTYASWSVEEQNQSAQTMHGVQVGVEYAFPLNSDVTVTFRCLPEDENLRSTLKIQQVRLDELNLPDDFETDAKYAYDITTDMADGTFKYDVTLPKAAVGDASILYIEKTLEEAKVSEITSTEIREIAEDKLEQVGDVVKAIEVDHFTIFIPTVDVDGPNDYPGQKDLTKFSFGLISENIYEATFSWDEVTITNPVDACILINSDGDSGVNYAICVHYNTDGSYETLNYSCNDRLDKPLNCWDAALLPSVNSIFTVNPSCVVETTPDDPFASSVPDGPGDDFPDDRTAECIIKFKSTFVGEPEIINVCSYPSGPPNSNASDCLGYSGGGFIEIIKVADPDDDTLFSFSVNSDSFIHTEMISGSGQSSLISVPAGKYSIIESQQAGWALDNAICDGGSPVLKINGLEDIDVDAGNTIRCTFTNSLQEGSLIVKKIVTNNNGGTAFASDFSIHVKDSSGTEVSDSPAAGSEIGKIYTLNAGTYDVNEDAFIGYSPSYSSDCHNVAIAAGETKTCTITNDDQPGTLIVKKIVINDNGGTLEDDDFYFSVNGDAAIPFEADGQNDLVVDADTYSITEPTVTGYATTYDNCSSLIILNGESATCTITNDDIAPSLTINKIVVNDNGGDETVGAFEIKIGTGLLTFGAGVENGDMTTYTSTPSVIAGVSYALSEKDLPGYTEGSWGCKDDSTGADVSNPVVLSPGQNVTCTITNDDIQPKLTVTKIVYGGTKLIGDFSLFVDQTEVMSGIQNGFNVGSYIVSETPDGDYNPVLGGACASDGSVTLNIGEEKACTITNTRKQGNITFIKHVTVGDESPSSWTFNVYQGGQLVGTYNHSELVSLNTGSYTVIENGPGSYFLDSIGGSACSASALPGVANLTVSENGGACIFGNSEKATITINKIVNPSNSDTFYFSVTTNPAEYLGTKILGDGESHTFFDLMPGSYNIVETIDPNYSTVVFCNGTLGGPNSFLATLEAGDNLICNFTNTQDAFIVVDKITDPAGDSTLFDFTTNYGSPFTLADGDTPNNSGDLKPGIYSVLETPKFGWDQTNVTCSDGSDPSAISLQAGEYVTCTFTNTQRGVIAGKKWADLNGNGIYEGMENNEPMINGWTIFIDADGNGQLNGGELSTVTAVDNANPGQYKFENLIPGNYSVCEVEQPGWERIYPAGSNCQNVTVPAGPIQTDPYWNGHVDFGNRQLGSILAHKFEDEDLNGTQNGAEIDIENWLMSIYHGSDCSGNPYQQGLTDNFGNIKFDSLVPGDYSIGETLQPGWRNISDLCQNVNVAPAEQEIVNFGNLHQGEVAVYKFEDLNTNGFRDDGEQFLPGWEMHMDADAGANFQQTTTTNGSTLFILDPGNYSLFETNQDGWLQSGIYCDNQQVEEIIVTGELVWTNRLLGVAQEVSTPINPNALAVTVNPGDQISCYVGNYINNELYIEKSNDAWPNDKKAGDEITYTIKVMAVGGSVFDVSLFDVPSDQFEYLVGSYTANSSNGDDLRANGTTSEPTYASPGKWILGDLVKDEIIVLTYKVKIGDSADPGVYPDMAWATGTSVQSRDSEGSINDLLALSDPNFTANTSGTNFDGSQGHYGEDNFAGTQVALVETPSDEYGIAQTEEKEGSVLGVTTELPATGARAWLTLLSIFSALVGAILLLFGQRRRRGASPLLILIILSAALWLAKPAQALTSVRIEEPYNNSAEYTQDAETYQKDIKIDFVVLNTDNLSVSAQCQQQKNNGTWINITTNYAIKAGGNSGYCEANDLSNNSYYDFRIVISGDSTTKYSDEVRVGIDTDRPSKPTSYSKNKINNCDYEIKFHTADDGQTSRVEVYRSDNNESFTANADSRIAQITIGPNQDYTLITSRPDCQKTYYYAIRAFNDSDNGSDLIGDVEITTIITEATVGTMEVVQLAAIPVDSAFVADVIAGEARGDVAEETSEAEEEATGGADLAETAEADEGLVLGTATETLLSFLSRFWLPISIGLIVLAGLLVIFFKRDEK